MINLEDYIRDIENFPKPGVLFKDITPLLGDRNASEACLNDLLTLVDGQKIDKVVALNPVAFSSECFWRRGLMQVLFLSEKQENYHIKQWSSLTH